MGNGSAKGYESRIHDEITSDIGTLYTDHYSILKELIQNADDAGANEFNVAFLHPSKRYSHPLLTGPLLLFVNDAKFTAENAHAIHQRRNSDKTTDGSKIGMFGLGLKSVFHLCQAFFYVSSPEVIAAAEVEKERKYRRSDILNPWGDERFRAWNDVSDNDLAVLREVSRSFIFGPSKDFFALFIPLRLRRHCIESETQNPKRFAFSTGNDAFFDNSVSSPPPMLFSDDVLSDLPRLMPLLSTLNRMSFWTADDSDSRVHIGTVERFPELHADWRKMKLERVPQTGRIEVLFRAPRNKVSYCYGGIQQKMLSADLEQIRARDAWPEIWPEDENISTPVKIDVPQHSAIIFLDGAGSEPLRGVLETVFLPLTRGKPQDISSVAKRCSEILLHAARFPDSARKKIDRLEEGRSQGEESVRQAWNRIIEVRGIHPLLIPALEVYCRTVAAEASGQERITLLTQKLSESEYFRKFRPVVCQSVGWVWRLTERGFVWSVVSMSDCESIVALPAFGDDHSLPTTVFASLKDFSSSTLITVTRTPRLFPTSESEENLRLPEGFCKSLLLSVVGSEVAENEKQLKYLADAVTAWKGHLGKNDFIALITALRAILEHLTDPSEPQKKNIKRLIGVVPDGMLLPISFPLPTAAGASNIFISMLDCSIDALPIPTEFVSGVDRSFAQLSTEHARVLLVAIIGVRDKVVNASNEFTSTSQVFINDTLNAWIAAQQETFEVFNDLTLFYGRQAQATGWFNASTLMEQNVNGVVFEGKASSLGEFTKGLDASEKMRLIFLTSDATQVLCKWIGQLPKCDAKGFIKLLKNKPKLSTDLAARSACIEAIAAKCSLEKDSDARFGIRYLLHGEPTAYESTASLLVDSGDAWSEMAKAILLARSEVWRLIAKTLVNLKRSDIQSLDVHKCNAETGSQLVVGLPDLSSVDCSAIVDDKPNYTSILKDWPENGIEQLKRLKTFPRSKTRELVAITKETFIEGDFFAAFDSIFPNRVFVSDETGMLKKRGLASTVDPAGLVAKVLTLEKPQLHWEVILGSLSQKSDEDAG